jgi:Xaa-Pro aminopeptidase
MKAMPHCNSAEAERAYTSLRAAGLDFALLSSDPNITYVSGYEVPLQVGPVVDFSGGRLAVLALLSVHDRTGWLIVPDMISPSALQQSRLNYLETYSIFGHFAPIDAVESLQEALRTVLRKAGAVARNALLGIEPLSLSSTVYKLLALEFSNLDLRDATSCLEVARRVKTPREIELLRRAASVADAGQQCLLEQAKRSGESDLDVWTEIARRMVHEVNHPLVLTGELVTGPRTAIVAPGGPIGRQIARGDVGILDISPRVDGYWADCTNTVVFDAEPTSEQQRYFQAARTACEAAIEMLRPGARACDVEAKVRATLEQHGFQVAHYSGHQLGTSVNEKPRLVPYDNSTIEPGMVFAVEPGVYAGEGGITGARAEKIVLVTESGPEVLSQFPWGI